MSDISNHGNFVDERMRSSEEYAQEISREFFKSVYSYMGLALAVTGLVSYTMGTSEWYIENLISETGGLSALFYVFAFSPIILVFLIQAAYKRFSFLTLNVLFFVFAGLMGASLSSIFLVYSMGTIASTFFVTAGAFGGMAILGYTTKTDLTKMGSLLYMVFIGMFIASLVQFIFPFGESFNFVFAILGVFVFTGLTAYYMQQLKGVSRNVDISGVDRSKIAVIGALQLYMLFVNLFLSLLQLFGRD